MCQEVDTLAHEVDPRFLSLVVQILKLMGKAPKEIVPKQKLFFRDPRALQNRIPATSLQKLSQYFRGSRCLSKVGHRP